VLDQVAEALKDQPNTYIAKIDATVYKNISHEHNIKSFPTLLYAKDGVVGRYEGARNKEAFVTFMTRLAKTTYHTITSVEELNEKIKTLPFAFVLSLPEAHTEKESWLKLFADIASRLHMKIDFLVQSHVDVKELSFQKMETGRSSISFTLPQDSNVPSVEALESFVLRFNRQLVTEIDNHNFKPLASLNHPLCLLVLDYQQHTTTTGSPSSLAMALTNAFDRAASQAVIPPPEHAWDDLVLGHVDGVKWRTFFRQYGVESSLPSLLFLNLTIEAYAPFPLPQLSSNGMDHHNQITTEEQLELYASSIESEVTKLIQEYQAGQIEMKIFKKLSKFDRLLRPLRHYYPWSLFFAIPFVVTVIALIVPNPTTSKRKNNKID